MSVLARFRSQSGFELVNNARKLVIKTIKASMTMPKRYTFFGVAKLCAITLDIYLLVIEGNSVYPANQNEVRLRREKFIDAKSKCFAYIGLLCVLDELFTVKPERLEELATIVDTEISLVKGILEKDSNRYKNIKE